MDRFAPVPEDRQRNIRPTRHTEQTTQHKRQAWNSSRAPSTGAIPGLITNDSRHGNSWGCRSPLVQRIMPGQHLLLIHSSRINAMLQPQMILNRTRMGPVRPGRDWKRRAGSRRGIVHTGHRDRRNRRVVSRRCDGCQQDNDCDRSHVAPGAESVGSIVLACAHPSLYIAGLSIAASGIRHVPFLNGPHVADHELTIRKYQLLPIFFKPAR